MQLNDTDWLCLLKSRIGPDLYVFINMKQTCNITSVDISQSTYKVYVTCVNYVAAPKNQIDNRLIDISVADMQTILNLFWRRKYCI